MPMSSCSGAPSERPATITLQSRRLTSHSHGPTVASSKSLMSNTIAFSGERNMPKFDRCASPQTTTSAPVVGPAARSADWMAAVPR